jgi:hypothetical protein
MFRGKDVNGVQRHISRSKARVIDNRDPYGRGFIRVEHSITGTTAWIPYLKSPGIFDVPSIGDIVYLEAEAGNGQYPVAHGMIENGVKENERTPEQFKRQVPTNRGLHSPDGHFIELDDGVMTPTDDPNVNTVTTENRGIRITSSSGNRIHIIEDDDADERQIVIEDINGNLFRIDTARNTITINSELDLQQLVANDYKEFTGNNKEVTVENDEIVEVKNNKTDTIGGNLTINVTGDAVINADGNVNISATGDASIEATGEALLAGAAGTAVGSGGSQTDVLGSQVTLGGSGTGVARVGDRAFGVGNLGAPVSSTIIQGSSKVFSG